MSNQQNQSKKSSSGGMPYMIGASVLALVIAPVCAIGGLVTGKVEFLGWK